MAAVYSAEQLLQEYAKPERNFAGSYLANAQLSGKTLSGSYLGYSYLGNANFSNTDLSNADFTNANLTGANFNGATLKGTKFTNAILKDADFKGAKLDGVIFSDTPAPVLASGQFQVQAIQPAGVPFTNPINAEVTIVFTPSGTWSLAGYNNDAWVCTSAGRVGPSFDAHRPYSPYPAYLLGALVAGSNLSNTGTLIDGEKRIRMKPNETLTFLMNDNRNGYADNTGALTVTWKALATS